MNWTKEKPTESGYYWYRTSKGDADAVLVNKFTKKAYFIDLEEPLFRMHGQWSDSLIPQPQD